MTRRMLVGRGRQWTATAVGFVVVVMLAMAPSADAYVYWADNGPGSGGTGTNLGRANLDAGGLKSNFATTAGNPGVIVSDGSHTYWTESGGAGYAIGRANPDGSGATSTFIAGAATSGGVFGIAVTSSYIYWTSGTGHGYIGRANLDGTGANNHFIDLGSSSYPFGIAALGGTLYVGADGQIVTVPAVASSSPTVTPFFSFAGFSANAVDIVINGGYVYWAEINIAHPSSIGRAATNGAGPSEYFVPNLGYPTGVATDGAYLYWVDHQTSVIGRAVITSGSPTNVQDFISSDSNGPWGVAVDSLIDPTSTSVTCSPTTVPTNNPSVCTATVNDSASSEVSAGVVLFSGSANTFFPGANSCTLTPRPGGGASCTAGAESATAGAQSVTASYTGDSTHSSSTGTGQYCAGDASVCGSVGSGAGGGGTSGSQPTLCHVPKLKGKTLARARKLLVAAHCRLGRVTKPRARKGHKPSLVVGRQSRTAGRKLPNGTKISLRLVVKPRPKGR
jgi:hypothetical protein